jgi:hypothetical protein
MRILQLPLAGRLYIFLGKYYMIKEWRIREVMDFVMKLWICQEAMDLSGSYGSVRKLWICQEAMDLSGSKRILSGSYGSCQAAMDFVRKL